MMDWLDLLAVQMTIKSLLQHQSSKASILQHSAVFTVQLSHWPLSGCRHGSLTVGRTPTKEALASSRVSQGSTSSMPTLCPQAASTLQAGNAFHRSFISCWAWGSCPKHMCAGAGGSAGPLASIGCTQGHSLSRTESGRVAWGRKGICLGTTCGESRNGTESSVNEWITSVQFSRSVVSDSLRPHELQQDRKSTRLNSSHTLASRMPSSA